MIYCYKMALKVNQVFKHLPETTENYLAMPWTIVMVKVLK
jgi:hypothetical protein